MVYAPTALVLVRPTFGAETDMEHVGVEHPDSVEAERAGAADRSAVGGCGDDGVRGSSQRIHSVPDSDDRAGTFGPTEDIVIDPGPDEVAGTGNAPEGAERGDDRHPPTLIAFSTARPRGGARAAHVRVVRTWGGAAESPQPQEHL